MQPVNRVGTIEWINGPVIVGTGIDDVEIGEVVEVGEEGLIGEIIRIIDEEFTVQVYENTSGIKPGEEIVGTGQRLVAELGPGILNNIYDGIGRPLMAIEKDSGAFIARGFKINMLDRIKDWHFTPVVKNGDTVKAGDCLGTIEETTMITHRILVPPNIQGRVYAIGEGDFTVEDTIGTIEANSGKYDVRLMQEWPVRVPRPFEPDGRLDLDEPLMTGQRVTDVFFPIAKGGSAAIPGGFGTGKTIMLHQLAKWSDTDIVIYIGCGERGNEMSEVVTDFPKLVDPRTGKLLMERTVLIANTSNMPVMARESSIYFGVTIAEYYRDQGYKTLLIADSTSRWAEALRELSGRLEEIPAERGYPAYLADKLAAFYERSGNVKALGKPEREGSVTIVGAVSPPGGDFNEPVTINTLRFCSVFWALDTELAYGRHFPAINWLRSYSVNVNRLIQSWATSHSNYVDNLVEWWKGRFYPFPECRMTALSLLSEAAEIESIARIIGESSLPDDQRLFLLTAELLKEGFLRQDAFHDVESYCEPEKQFLLLEMIIDFFKSAKELMDQGVSFEEINRLPQISRMKRVKYESDYEKAIRKLTEEIASEFTRIVDSRND